MNHKYLILGSKGLLGSELVKAAVGRDIIAVDREEIDINDAEALRDLVMDLEPTVILNAAGYTDVAKAEEEPEKATELNGYAVGRLAHICREFGIVLVHFSTDYIFNGEKRDGYNEDDSPAPINKYGLSKYIGEQALFDEMEMEKEGLPDGKFYLIRLSYLFGKSKQNIVNKLLEKIRSNQDLITVDDQFFKLTYAHDLALQTFWLIESNEYEFGTYHITNSGILNWLDLVTDLMDELSIHRPVNTVPLNSWKSTVLRPQYSALNNTKLPELRSWREAVNDYLHS